MGKSFRLYLIPLTIIVLCLLGLTVYAGKPDNRDQKNKDDVILAGPDMDQLPDSEDIVLKKDPADEPGGESPESDLKTPSESMEEEISPPSVGRPEKKEIVFDIAVIGEEQEIIYGPAKVKAAVKHTGSFTALDALDATGMPYHVSARWPGFVEAVANLRNKGQSGWMYQVNDEIPLVAADKKLIETGDRIIWWYSKSINTQPPSWEQL